MLKVVVAWNCDRLIGTVLCWFLGWDFLLPFCTNVLLLGYFLAFVGEEFVLVVQLWFTMWWQSHLIIVAVALITATQFELQYDIFFSVVKMFDNSAIYLFAKIF